MRAVSIALCVALAGHAAANIFYKQYQPPMETLIMQPSDYVDQYKSQDQYHTQSDKKYQPQYQSQDQYQMQSDKKYQPQYQSQDEYHTQSDQKYQPQYQSQDQYQMQSDKKYQPQYQMPDEKKYQPKYQKQSDKKYKPQYQMKSNKSYQSQEQYQPQYQSQEQYQPQYQMQIDKMYEPQYQTQSEQKSQMTKYQKQQKAIRSKKQRKPVDSGEAMSEERSWSLSMPVIPRGQPAPAKPWAQPWSQPTVADAAHGIEAAPAHGDVIAWRDIQIADGPYSPITDKKEIERIFADAYETMAHIKPEDKHAIHTAFEAAMHDHDGYLEAQMNASQLIRSHGFTVAEHTVRTADGYLLTLLHVAAAGAGPAGAPVLLMPGLLGGADDWLRMGPQHSLAFRLAGAGRDVWLGNFRGGRYARAHVALHPAQDQFWQFSIDDLALRDLPAVIDHVLADSGKAALHYVAHSLGAAAALELLAAEPAYQGKVAGVYALAPLWHTGGARSPLLRMMAPGSGFSALMTAQLGEGRFQPSRGLLSSAGGALLQAELGCANVSASARLVLSGVRIPDAAAAAAAARAVRAQDAASVRVVRQLAAAAPAFARYDHGARLNRQLYGAAAAPAVDPARVAVPVLLLPAAADWLAAPADVQRLATQLPRATLRTLPHADATGLDLLFSERVAGAANDIVMQAIADAIAAEPATAAEPAIAAEPAGTADPADSAEPAPIA